MNLRGHEDERLKILVKLLQERLEPQRRWGKMYAVGIVEGLLHFTGTYAPDGDLSVFAPRAIADFIGWPGDADALIVMLESAGYLKTGRFDGWELLSEWDDG